MDISGDSFENETRNCFMDYVGIIFLISFSHHNNRRCRICN